MQAWHIVQIVARQCVTLYYSEIHSTCYEWLRVVLQLLAYVKPHVVG